MNDYLIVLLERVHPVISALAESMPWPANPPQLLPEERLALHAWLEHVLVNPTALAAHRHLVDELLRQQAALLPPLGADRTSRVVEAGLEVLSDAELAALVLDTDRLASLQQIIGQRLPEAWLAAMAHDGQALLEAHGVDVSFPLPPDAACPLAWLEELEEEPLVAATDDQPKRSPFASPARPRLGRVSLPDSGPSVGEALPDAIRRLITALVRSDRELGSLPTLPLGSRASLVGHLERILVNRDTLHSHIRLLQELLEGNFRHDQLLSGQEAGRILHQGPAALDNAALATLLLNPVALYGLYDTITEELPEAWLGPMAQDGLALMEHHGVHIAVPPIWPSIILIASQALRFRGSIDAQPAADDEERAWDLATKGSDPNIPLPEEVAESCYGEPARSVKLRLLARAEPMAPESLRPQVEVEPAPTHGPLMLVVTFPRGESRTLTVEPVTAGPPQALSSQGEPLSPAAFGEGNWQLTVELSTPL